VPNYKNSLRTGGYFLYVLFSHEREKYVVPAKCILRSGGTVPSYMKDFLFGGLCIFGVGSRIDISIIEW